MRIRITGQHPNNWPRDIPCRCLVSKKTYKNRDKYLSFNKSQLKFKNISNIKYEKLDEIVSKYVCSANSAKVPIDGPNIQVFAKEVANKMKLTEFKGSKGWLQKFNNRNGIKLKSISSESADVDLTIVNHWFSNMAENLAGFQPENIYNYDETGLFIKLLPNKSYLIDGSDHFGGKAFKQRITVGLCCSMTGEKLKPLIVAKALRPTCFKNINYNINKL